MLMIKYICIYKCIRLYETHFYISRQKIRAEPRYYKFANNPGEILQSSFAKPFSILRSEIGR